MGLKLSRYRNDIDKSVIQDQQVKLSSFYFNN